MAEPVLGGGSAEHGVRNEVGGSTIGPVVQAHTVRGGVHLHSARPDPVTPRQLPAAPRLFTGRADELATLTLALNDAATPGATVMISAIGGAGGIGKTWLALHWAHQHADRFPDGHLFVNLRGFDPTEEPMLPAAAVRGFLDALGVDPAAIPIDLDAQAGLYRSLVAGKRMLIMLDNARDATHAAPLLPGSPTCTVLVTSRHKLGGLIAGHGAVLLDLDVLPASEARELMVHHLGSARLAAEPDAVLELLAFCEGLPLALGIVAARATTHPNFPLAVLAEELREASTRLDALNAGDSNANLRAVLSWSYHALDAEAAAVFGLLGLAWGPDIGLSATASLTALSVTRARVILRELENAHLVQQHVPGRYRMHDLVRLYAAEQADRDLSAGSRGAALQRLVDFYLHTAHTGERLLNPNRPLIQIGRPATGCVPQPLTDVAEALGWFDTEHPGLLATQQAAVGQGWHPAVWQLAWTLDTYHFRQGHLHNEVACWRAGLAAAERLGDPIVQTLAHRLLGHAYLRTGRHTEALDHLEQAVILAEYSGDTRNQARAHYNLASAWALQGDDQQALTHATRALHLYQTLNNPVWQAEALNAVGWYHARLDHYDEARTLCEQALTLHRMHRHRDAEADTLDTLGYITHHTGQHTQALAYYHQALTLFRDLGNSYQVASTLEDLGKAHAALGQHTDARRTWQQALNLYHAQHRTTDADRIQQQLDTLDQHPS
jgi:tetratricopeptide (TPR) repeat protein